MAPPALLPTYRRFANGAAPPPLSRRSFRPRERYLILLVFLTFCVVCFGAFFFLPEFRGSGGAVNGGVYKVYRRMQKAGPELLIPAPPLQNELGDPPDLVRHNDREGVDPHLEDDRLRLRAKIEEDETLKVLERPEPPEPPSPPSPPQPSEPPSAGGGGAEPPPRVNVPPASADVYPLVTGGEDADPQARERRNAVKQMMKHAWDNYKLYAWGKNELRPISKRGHTTSIFGSSNLGATILDGLDTLYIMGLDKEFQEGRDWIAENFNLDNTVSDLSVFETTIRFVGGMLTCFALTGDTVFRDKAQHVADKLLPAFQTPTGIPHSLINPSTGMSKNYGWASGGSSILSEIGTLHLEFSYLSDVTGNSIYREKVNRVREVLHDAAKPKGLYPNYISPKTGKWGQHHMSLGGLGDSFYEYLLKAWIQNKEDQEAREMFDEAMKPILENMIRVSPGGLTYVADLKYDRILEDKMDHLSCFSGGMFALASKTLQTSMTTRFMELAQGLTNTCHESYIRSPTKLGPEAFRFSEAVEAKALKTNEKYYILRPETIESYFVLWRLTKNQKYRDWGWEAVQAIEKHCRVDGGYTGIRNVYLEESPKDDVQQSFFLAETLKYLYLLFSDDSLISLNEWVFNTEAHPLPIKGNPYYRDAQ